MDYEALAKAIQALNWEANYRKRSKNDASAFRKFLAIEPTIDADFERFFTHYNITNGTLLDIGTGTGEQAIYLAQKGFIVTATDISPTAIIKALEQAKIHNVAIDLIEDNIISTSINSQFDIVTDRGCYSLIPPYHHATYLATVKKLLKAGGWFLLKADKRSESAINFLKENIFFNIVFLEESFYTNLNKKQVKAIFFAMQHTDC